MKVSQLTGFSFHVETVLPSRFIALNLRYEIKEVLKKYEVKKKDCQMRIERFSSQTAGAEENNV